MVGVRKRMSEGPRLLGCWENPWEFVQRRQDGRRGETEESGETWGNFSTICQPPERCLLRGRGTDASVFSLENGTEKIGED